MSNKSGYLSKIKTLLSKRDGGLLLEEIGAIIPAPRRTLQRYLAELVDQGEVVREGKARAIRYKPATQLQAEAETFEVSKSSQNLLVKVTRPISQRRIVGYQRDFLEKYIPNETYYLTKTQRDHLLKIGRSDAVEMPAGTYARRVLNRLLIDLSWNSSRLEGNTYSLLDTKDLLEFGKQAEGHRALEAQMILNHKDGIEFLVENAREIGFNYYTITNLHGFLSQNLLTDPEACGRLRKISVHISGSVYVPLDVPQRIEECFRQMLEIAERIQDPFEQAFFILVQVPYLQPFDNVNKRVSRLAANIPFIKGNLCPLSFVDVPLQTYIHGLLAVYELREVGLLRDVFIWAYERSVAKYRVIQQILGEPDLFQLKYRSEIKTAVGTIVREAKDQRAAASFIRNWAEANILAKDQIRFIAVIETQLASLHDGNFARFQIRPSEFARWKTLTLKK